MPSGESGRFSRPRITDVMIPYERIAKLSAENEAEASKLLILDVIHMMSEAATRVIVVQH
jgi:hypothetical protein